MALFQKKPQASSSAPLYTLGLHKTVLIVGLGNIGKQYEKTRHNVGFVCVDAFVDSHELGPWVEKKDLKCHEVSGTIGANQVIVIKPTTLMNLSGDAVQAVSHFYKVPLEQIIVVHDELALDFGQIRTRVGGESAGNNGIKSIIASLGPDFGRVRIGIKNSHTNKQDSADFVLAKFSKDELVAIPELTRETTALLIEYLYSGQLPHDTRNFLA